MYHKVLIIQHLSLRVVLKVLPVYVFIFALLSVRCVLFVSYQQLSGPVQKTASMCV